MATITTPPEYRNHLGQIRTASTINTLLGLWLIASAWVYGLVTTHGAGAWNSIVVGIVIAIFGIVRSRAPRRVAALSWINIILGIWTLISPWVFGFAGREAPMWNAVIAGILIALLAIWSGSVTMTGHRHHQAA